jgi:hypothetical protein
MHLGGPGSIEPIDPGYVGAKRIWNAGEIIEVKYQMKLRSEPSGVSGRDSFWFGPWLLGAPASENPAYFNELTTQNQVTGDASPDKGQAQGPGQFSVPMAATAIAYLQAEYPDQPGTVHLRPIAEQTGQPTTPWEVRFLTGNHR